MPHVEQHSSITASNEYCDRIRDTFASLKAVTRFDEAISRSLKIPDNRGYLCCVSEMHLTDEHVIGLLADFRANAATFHNSFTVTHEGTRRWLKAALLDVPDRILFLVMDTWGHVIGHLGFAHADNPAGEMELDNVIRGISHASPGLMSMATECLIRWANDTFGPRSITLRTLDDNHHAIRFYSVLGFTRTSLQPLRRVEANGEINHIPMSEADPEKPDRFFVCMSRPLAKAA